MHPPFMLADGLEALQGDFAEHAPVVFFSLLVTELLTFLIDPLPTLNYN
jgi:hypothetical protein